jgi:hypothetical protein
MSKRIFSFCIYGDNPKYCLGMIKNLEQINELFPEFYTYITLGNNVSKEYIEKYKTFKNVKLIDTEFNNGRLMSYRFFPIDDEDVEVMFVRDADSRFGDRDIWCINHFINSSYNLFTIRDHTGHYMPLMGGLWGVKKMKNLNIRIRYKLFIKSYKDIDGYSNDQNFLSKFVYDNFKSHLIVYGKFNKFEGENCIEVPIPYKNDEDFMGNAYDFNYGEFIAMYNHNGLK